MGDILKGNPYRLKRPSLMRCTMWRRCWPSSSPPAMPPAARCFAIANDEEDFQLPAPLEALKLATKLVQASAAAASAVKRVKGGEFHHHVTVQRIDYPAEKAARKAREKVVKETEGEAVQRIEERVGRAVEQELCKLTPEERATVEAIWLRAGQRDSSFSQNGAGETAQAS